VSQRKAKRVLMVERESAKYKCIFGECEFYFIVPHYLKWGTVVLYPMEKTVCYRALNRIDANKQRNRAASVFYEDLDHPPR